MSLDDQIHEIDVAEMITLIDEGTVLIDVREDEEVEAGMIDGALHMPLSSFEEHEEDLPGSKPIIFYCRSGRRSLKAAELASAWTDQTLYSLAGGYLAYLKEG